MPNKKNVFLVMSDYQLQIALSTIKEFHYFDSNIILFFYRKTNLINYLDIDWQDTKIHLLSASEFLGKHHILYGLFNEIIRIKNYIKSTQILRNQKICKIYLAIEEEHFLATVSWIISFNINTKIVHLEEGNVVHIDPEINPNFYNIKEAQTVSLLKNLRNFFRRVYFGKNELKNKISITYGRASFYEYAVVLSAIGLSDNLSGNNHVQLNHKIFSETLISLFSFNSPLIHIHNTNSKILLIITDGETTSNQFDSKVYSMLIQQLWDLAINEGYEVFLKNHPIEFNYLNILDKDVPIINENLPAEYYLTKWKERLIVVGGSSTSLGVSVILGIPTFSYIDLYNRKSELGKIHGKEFLVSQNVNILVSIEEILNN